MALANITLDNTFDEWRIRTNQIIYKVDEFEIVNTIYLASNTANSLLIQGTANLGANVYFTIRTSNNVNDTANANIASMFAANQIHELAITSFNSSNGVNVWNYTYASNTVMLAANAAFDQANITAIASAAGYNKANTAYDNIGPAYDKANTACTSAAAASTAAGAGFDKANTACTSAAAASTAAGAAFGKANTACTSAAAASTAAGAAFGKANTANVIAVSAFIRANVSPSSGAASSSDFVAGTSSTHSLTPSSVWTTNAVLTDSSPISVNFASGFNFSGSGNAPLALGGDRTLGNPTNVKNSQSGILWFTATGATRNLTLGTSWWLCDGVEADPYAIAVGALLGVAYVVNGSYVYVTGIIRRDDYDAE